MRMALALSLNSSLHHERHLYCPIIINPIIINKSTHFCSNINYYSNRFVHTNRRQLRRQWDSVILNSSEKEPNSQESSDEEVNDLGVKAALALLKFYKREISPLLPRSCRYVPTCSEYSMIAYKKYGFVKGTILTTWRLCRCNPFGGSGFDPPRWFDEKSPTEH